nr:EOG090X072S [Sida crystallina]
MAFYDNKYWILSHIRNSFLYSDDTGMCEMVHLNVDIPKIIREEGKKQWYGQLDDSEEEYDDDGRIHARSMGNGNDDFGARRRRLNTVVRLEKMKKEQQAAALISTVRWKEPEKKTESVEKEVNIFEKKEITLKKATSPKSALSLLLAQHASEPDSPFLSYAKFDGTSQIRTPTRTIKIFMTMQNKEDRNYPLHVCVVASAKVSELIGLACYKHNHERREPQLTGPVGQFALFIAEDDGSPDADFPCLEPREVVGKFGFTTLALVRVASPKKDAVASRTLADADRSVLPESKAPNPSTEPEPAVLESTDFHSFTGFLLHKVRPKTEISLAIMYYHTEKRKWCRLRIECDAKTIEQVTAKLRFIMEIRGGHYRQEYLRHASTDHSTKRKSSNQRH